MGRKVFTMYRVSNDFALATSVHEFRDNHLIKRVGGSNNYLVLMALTSHIEDKDNTCFPSLETIADIVCMSTKTVSRTLKDLESRGLIIKESVKSTKSNNYHNKYTLLDIVEDVTEDEENGSEENRLLAHFRNKFMEKYHTEYKATHPDNDMRDLTKLLEKCNYDFEYACRIIDKHIDTYLPKGKYQTANIYFLVNCRLSEIKRELTKEDNLQKKAEERKHEEKMPTIEPDFMFDSEDAYLDYLRKEYVTSDNSKYKSKIKDVYYRTSHSFIEDDLDTIEDDAVAIPEDELRLGF